jgi:hypothetical protein
MIVTPWDRTLAARTTLSFAALGLLTTVVLVTTDEVGATWGARVARLAALAPALAALAVGLVVRTLERPGQDDLLALRCSGVSRSRALLGGWVAGIALGGLGCVALASGIGSLDGLLPPTAGHVWVHGADGSFAGPGVRLEGPASPARFEVLAAGGRAHPRDTPAPTASSAGATDSPGTLRWCVAATVGLFALLLPRWSSETESAARRGIVGFVVVASAVVAFHAVAAGRSAVVLLGPPSLLAGYAAAKAALAGVRTTRAVR